MNATMTTTTGIEQLKAAHRATWDSGDYAPVAETLVLEVADAAVAAAGPRPARRSSTSPPDRATPRSRPRSPGRG